MIVFDPRPELKECLPSPLLDPIPQSGLYDPYIIHDYFLEGLVDQQDKAVWCIRDLVRNIEQERNSVNVHETDYPYFHDVARHAIHVTETLDVAIATVEDIKMEHEQFVISQLPVDTSSKNTRTKIAESKVRQGLSFAHNMLRSLRHRSLSNQDRLVNEIQLAFNKVAQYDSGISIEIGRAAQTDSAAMKTIAFLTLIFLPATFISSVFSMSFFNFSPDTGKWTRSNRFWVYWVVTIPITVLVGFLWLLWQKYFPPPQIGEDKQKRGWALAKQELKDIVSKLKKKEDILDKAVGSEKV